MGGIQTRTPTVLEPKLLTRIHMISKTLMIMMMIVVMIIKVIRCPGQLGKVSHWRKESATSLRENETGKGLLIHSPLTYATSWHLTQK